jgi:hypothetical protein
MSIHQKNYRIETRYLPRCIEYVWVEDKGTAVARSVFQ